MLECDFSLDVVEGSVEGSATYLCTIKYHHSTKLHQADMQKLNVSYVAPPVVRRLSTIRSLALLSHLLLEVSKYLPHVTAIWAEPGYNAMLCHGFSDSVVKLEFACEKKKFKNLHNICSSRFAMTNG